MKAVAASRGVRYIPHKKERMAWRVPTTDPRGYIVKHPKQVTALIATALAVCWFHLWAAGAEKAARPTAPQAMSEIRSFFAEYLRLHAAREMDKWRELFLPEAVCVSASPDGTVRSYPASELARSIAEEARRLRSQHETFEDTRMEVYGHTALYATNWTLYHDGKPVRKGRAFFSLVKKDGAWRIAALVWQRD